MMLRAALAAALVSAISAAASAVRIDRPGGSLDVAPFPQTEAVLDNIYYADLAYYRPQIEDAVALPEPDRMLAPCVAMLAWLGVRRRRAAAIAGAPAPR